MIDWIDGMSYKYSNSSLSKLTGVHPDLVKVAMRAIEISTQDFRLTCGRRTLDEQRYLVATGKSKTMKSRHLTGHAIDFVPLVNGQVSWDWKYFYPVAKAFKQAAKELGVDIKWGGDWKSFKDGPHIQLTWKRYPK